MGNSSHADIRTVRRALHLGLAALCGVVTFAAPAAGEDHAPATSSTTPTTAAPPPFAPPLSPPGADGAGRRDATAALVVAQRELNRARWTERRAARRVVPLEAVVAVRTAELHRLSAEEQAVAAQLEQARGDVKGLAIERYVGGGRIAPLNFLLGSRNATDFARRSSIADSASDAQQEAVDRYAAARAAVSALVGEAVARLAAAERDLAHARVEAAVALAEVRRLEDAVARRKLLVDLVAAAASVPPSDIPRLFLDAYQRAAGAMAVRRPTCKVRWTALAAIGRVESGHGRSKGARLALNGDLWPVILGKPLDGTSNTRHIPDTDGGELDGDSVVDRAVGPMQFIPSTWKRVRLDGNGDGVLNPNNAYDATTTAAEYLCRVAHAGPLDTDEGMRAAFFSYNRSEAYVEKVLAFTHGYDLLAISGQLRP